MKQIFVLGIILIVTQTSVLKALCTQKEKEAFLESIDLAQTPITDIIEHPDISRACKRHLLRSLGDALEYRAQNGLCMADDQQSCEQLFFAAETINELLKQGTGPLCVKDHNQESDEDTGDESSDTNEPECRVNEENAAWVTVADAQAAHALEYEVSHVEEKISNRMVPYCILPPECQSDGPDCQQALSQMWWKDTGFDLSDRKNDEFWLRSGGFIHLFLASAFTCSQGQQHGGTCAIYSGASLMAHYCSTPATNPNAAPGTCAMTGPGFQCVLPDQLLEDAYEKKVWKREICHTDDESGVVTCQATTDMTMESVQDNLASASWKKKCYDLANAPDQKACERLKRRSEKVSRTAAIRTTGAEAITDSNASLRGGSGAQLLGLFNVYQTYGFIANYYPASATGWDQALQSVADGHPVQIHIDVKSWKYYGNQGGPHAVVIEGAWNSPDGQKVIIRDSNFPEYIKIFDSDFLKATFFKGGGGVGVRPPMPPNP